MRLSSCFFIFFNFLFSYSFGQQYFETFDAGLTFPSGWTTNDPAKASIILGGATTASNYGSGAILNASAENQLFLTNCAPSSALTEVIISNINMTGRTDLTVGFGWRRTSSFDIPISLEFSTDGSIWNTIASNISSTNSAVGSWVYSTFSLPASANNEPNLRFRFRYTSDSNGTCSNFSGNFRIDDFIVDYTPPLPVKLLNFTAEASIDSKSLLSWSTTEELGFSHFEVERSLDAKGFESIGKINAKGGQDVSTSYSFVDDRPYNGISYYRLKQVDIDKTIQYSKIVSFNLTLEPKVLVYPNPISDFLVFENIKLEEIKNVNIYNVRGTLLNVTKLNSLRLNLTGIASQQLLVELELTDNTFIKRRILKQ